MGGQPALPRANQLVDLVVGHPVMLGVVQHRQQHVEVVQRIGQPHPPPQGEPHVPGVTPLGKSRIERHGRRVHLPAERLEQPPGEGGAAPAGQGGQADLQGNRAVGQLLP
jgi:hypothetical protein